MFQPARRIIVPPMVNTWTPGWSPFAYESLVSSAPASGTLPTSNLALYYPLIVPVLCRIGRLWWANGSTVSASYNVDCGIYSNAGNQPGTRLLSAGSTAQGTATSIQYVDVTDYVLPPGAYWLAFGTSSSSATFMRSALGNVALSASQFFRQTTSPFPLPATAEPIKTGTSSQYVVLCGFETA